MRKSASILHLDMDAFFASVEQRDKPSLRGKPVIVGGTGSRGVVAAASYEARQFGVHSAMSSVEARRLCPKAAVLGGRFDAYRQASRAVMEVLEEFSPLVEPLALDEAFVDLGQTASPDLEMAEIIRAQVRSRTGGLPCSVGLASSKLMAKIATGLAKPDGVRIVVPGSEQSVLDPLSVDVLPGVGPVTGEQLRRIGVETVAELRRISEHDLMDLFGRSAGASMHRMARGVDHRPVLADRDAKSISIEDTFVRDVTSRAELHNEVESLSEQLAKRMKSRNTAGRTVILKVRLHDFKTYTRSTTLSSAVESAARISTEANRLLDQLDTSGGVRLIGVGVSGLTPWIQDELFDDPAGHVRPPGSIEALGARSRADREATSPVAAWWPGMDVHHSEHGDGWVWGSGVGKVTIRFETRLTEPGPVLTFDTDDPALAVGHVDTVGA